MVETVSKSLIKVSKDILDVFIDTSIFFSTLRIVDRGYSEDIIEVHYIKNKDAKRLRSIIQGLIAAHRQQLDLTKINPDEIAYKIEELGKAKATE